MGVKDYSPKVLFLGISYSDVACESSFYTELVYELSQAGSDIRVVAPALEKSRTGLYQEGGIAVLRVAAGRLFEVRLFQKALNNLLLPIRYYLALRTQNLEWRPEWIITSTPPITLAPLVWLLKRKTKARAYLVLRDIFPQNAIDLGLMTRFGPVFWFFRFLEKWTYAAADRIGCMSPGNVRYLLEHNPGIEVKKLHVLPNWIDERHVVPDIETPEGVREEWGVQDNDLLCVFGGNLGKPQQVSFLLDVAEVLRHQSNIQIVIVGSGTESGVLKERIEARQLVNVILRDRLARDHYQKLLAAADVGIILLNQHFTIPNIPSRLTGYWAAGVAVLAATDTATDLDEMFLAKYGGGDWVRMGDVQAFVGKLRSYAESNSILDEMGKRGREAILQNFTARHAAATILNEMSLFTTITE